MIREIWMKMVNTNYNSTHDMINKLQCLKGKTKLNFIKNIRKYYDEMIISTFKYEEDSFSKNAQGISKNYHEVLLLLIFLLTKPQVKDMNIKCYDFYYTVIENRDEKEIVNDKNENNENDDNNFNDIIIPNHSISIEPREAILR